MPLETTYSLLQTLAQVPILTLGQLEQVTRLSTRIVQPRALAHEILRRGWATPYQINQLFLGKSSELVLGPYLLMERLGEGGAGQVFKARHLYLQRYVVIKVIREELLSDPDAVGRFYREVHAVGQLSHPNVVLAHDAGPVGQTHYFATEYLEGSNLDQLVQRQRLLPIPQASDYVRQAALGLQHIHEHGLVHHDIKPANLLVVPVEGGFQEANSQPMLAGKSFPWGLVKVLDLGLARLYEPSPNGAPAAGPARVGFRFPGSYVAPEQAEDFHRADIRADIYSLGCTLYFLLTGQPPFAHSAPPRQPPRPQPPEPTPIERLRSGLPRKLIPVVKKMMARRPGDRFQAPGEVAAALAAVQDAGWSAAWR